MPKLPPLARPLLHWFDQKKRDMPWRHTADPYAIWLSETMLQQTQVATVIPYYLRFLKRFPTVAALAQAPLQDVLHLWAGLGYYRRAKHLHAAAQQIATLHHGTLPRTAEALQSLPGIGRYTAAAVASIAFGQPVPVLDGNVARVLARLTLFDQPTNTPSGQKHLWTLAEAFMRAKPATARPGDFNQALMELGATLCTPRHPQCPDCPLKKICKARQQSAQESIPVKRVKPKVRQLFWVSAILRHPGNSPRYLLLQRPPGGLWESMWEFPTLELPSPLPAMTENGPTPNPVLLNWLAQISDVLSVRIGLRVNLTPWRGDVVHQLTHRTMHMAVVRGIVTGPRAPRLSKTQGLAYQAHRWVTLAQMRDMPVARITWRIAETAEIMK